MENKNKIKEYKTSTSNQTDERDNMLEISEEKQSKNNKLNITIHKAIYSGSKINKHDKEKLLNEMRNDKIANEDSFRTEKRKTREAIRTR